LLWLAWASGASAHEFRPAVLALQEQADGTYLVAEQPAFDGAKQPVAAVAPEFPSSCVRTGPRLDCGAEGLPSVHYTGLREYPVDVVVRLQFHDGRTRTEVLRGEHDEVELGDARQSRAELLARFVGLGVEHIALGADHLAFVLGLWLLVGFGRRLLWTVTGFTAAHSLTLGASTLGWVDVAPGPVEVVIALSIVLLAVEILRDRDSLTRRAPGAVAFGFGLLHGFGFAAALREVGLPPDHAWVALAGFNLGVELGQIVVLAAAVLASRAVGGRLGDHPRRLAATVGGAMAIAWTLQRVSAL
jgi:hydrogenase/urease accessory protein HupE